MTNISVESFRLILDELEDSGQISRTKSRELYEDFLKLKLKIEEEKRILQLKYDISWVESQAKSKISEEDFSKLLDELNENKTISSV